MLAFEVQRSGIRWETRRHPWHVNRVMGRQATFWCESFGRGGAAEPGCRLKSVLNYLSVDLY